MSNHEIFGTLVVVYRVSGEIPMGLEPPLVQFPQPPDNIPGNLDNLSRREQLMCSHPRRQQISHPNPHRIYEDWRLDAVRF